jgi:O-antigen/teichoic acid export membrane protein
MSALKTFVKQFSWLAAAEMWGKVIMFVLLTIVAHFGSASLGVYSYILSVMGIVSIASDFGTAAIYIREAKRTTEDRAHLFAQFLFLKFAIVIVCIGVSVVWVFTAHSTPEVWWNFLLYAGFIFFDTLTLLCLAHLRTHERFGYEAFVKVATKTVLLIVLGVAWLLGHLTLSSVFVAYVISGALGFIIAGASVLPQVTRGFWNGTFRPRLSIMKFAFLESFPLGLSTVFWQIYYRIDTVLLERMKGDVVTGYYNAAYAILQLINVLPSLAMVVLFPKLVDHVHADVRIYKKQMRLYAVAFLGAGVVLGIAAAVMAPLLPIYFGAEYAASVHLLRILAWTVPVLYMNQVLAQSLVAIKKTKTLTLITCIGLAVNISLNLVFIPTYGAVAAAWTTVITEYAVSLSLLCFLGVAHKKMRPA